MESRPGNENNRPEYPRPDFERQRWMPLNGKWDFAFDRPPEEGRPYDLEITVPFAYQTPAGGVGETKAHDRMFYRKRFSVGEEGLKERVFVHFGAVDYEAEVCCNGHVLGSHRGGYTPFSFELTGLLRETDNELTVKATDLPDTAQPRGKQYWKEEPDRCWYTPTSGIWQSVWLEWMPGRRVEEVHITPDIDRAGIGVDIKLEPWESGGEWRVEFEILYRGRRVQRADYSIDSLRRYFFIALQEEDAIDEVHYWAPEHPNLYDMKVSLFRDGRLQDRVGTYFGMRKISCENGRLMLNNSPYYLRMVLDQGYWEYSGLTPPSDEAIRRDVELCLFYGFNGARKHQKPEDPRYYYWCDKLGLLTWGELPAAYEFCGDERENLTRDMQEFIRRDYNHPSLIAWVPLNESWGVRKMKNDGRQQHFGESLYHLCKSWDPTRLVSANDGWEIVRGDIIGIHDYSREGSAFRGRYTKERLEEPEFFYPGGRKLLADGFHREGAALMITEYGGIALERDAVQGGWGYADAEKSVEALVERYRDVTSAIQDIPEICGFCYTQLTDVYQEVNGLLDSAHKVKVPAEKIADVNRRRVR